MRPVAIDLFSGAGGLSIGLARAGFDIAGAFDSWKPAVDSYRLNFTDHPCLLEDVSRLSADRLSELGMPQEVDLVAGGPPCQGFSQQRIGDDKDARNDLILAFARVVIATRARSFMMENVRGLLGARGRIALSQFDDLIGRAGYRVHRAVLDAADFGVAQHRRRVFLVGFRNDLPGEFQFPSPRTGARVTVREALRDVGIPAQSKSAAIADPLHFETPLTPLNRQRIEIVPPGGGFEDLPMSLRARCHQAGAARIGHRAVYGRLHPDRPAVTITAMFDSFTRGRFGHPIEPRNLTLREGARLQGFPDQHRFVGTKREIVKQIGNAIPPLMAEAVARSISRLLHTAQEHTRASDAQILAAAE